MIATNLVSELFFFQDLFHLKMTMTVIFIYMKLNYLTSENKNRENIQQNISYCIQKSKDDDYEFCQHEFSYYHYCSKNPYDGLIRPVQLPKFL